MKTMKVFAVLFYSGLLIGCSTSNTGELLDAYLFEANQRLPRTEGALVFERTIKEKQSLVTYVSFSKPGTPVAALKVSQNVINDKLREEYAWICKNQQYYSLTERGYHFKLRLVDHKGSFQTENHKELSTVDITEAFCRFTFMKMKS